MESRWSRFSFDYWITPTTINFILSFLLLAFNIINAVVFSLDQFLAQSQQSRNAVWQPSHHFFHPEGFGEERPTALHPCTSMLEYQSFIFPGFFCLKQNKLVNFCHTSGSICNALQIKSVELSVLTIMSQPWKHALKVNSGIETKLSNSQRLPNLSSHLSSNSLVSSPPLTTCLLQITSSNISLSCPHRLSC